jgi:hypothetical protein
MSPEVIWRQERVVEELLNLECGLDAVSETRSVRFISFPRLVSWV